MGGKRVIPMMDFFPHCGKGNTLNRGMGIYYHPAPFFCYDFFVAMTLDRIVICERGLFGHILHEFTYQRIYNMMA